MNFFFAIILLSLLWPTDQVASQNEEPQNPQVPFCGLIFESNLQGKKLKGPKGDAGFPGKRGEKGEEGRLGRASLVPGQKGSNGLTGRKGSQGLKGEEGRLGEPGLPGEPGFPGIPGSPGLDGLPGRASLVPGQKGSNGLAGRKGSQGLKGEKGSPGSRWGLGGCPVIKYHFPRAYQTDDYVRYRSYFPAMKEATICAWIKLPSTVDEEWFLSYAVTSESNEILVGFRDTSNIGVWVGGTSSNIEISSVATLTQLHVCVWFSSRINRRGAYVNGRSYRVVISTDPVQGGGDLILGQEQDGTNARGLDASQSFSGQIINLLIWPRVLTSTEVSNIARRCQCPTDIAVATTLDRVELHGEVSYSIPDRCPTL